MTKLTAILDFLMSNSFIYICVIVGLIILTTILCIVSSNKKKRKKIKEDFIEAEKIEAELEEIKDNEEPSELESILQKMQEDINVKPEDVVKKFEQEQEEKAIISYQELVDSVKSGKIELIDDEETNINFVENLNLEEESEPIMAVEENIESSVTPSMVMEAIESISNDSVKEEPKKFKQSEFISPVYGVMEDKLEYPKVRKIDNLLDIMNTKDYNELTDEIQRQEEFLNILKEFRNNL